MAGAVNPGERLSREGPAAANPRGPREGARNDAHICRNDAHSCSFGGLSITVQTIYLSYLKRCQGITSKVTWRSFSQSHEGDRALLFPGLDALVSTDRLDNSTHLWAGCIRVCHPELDYNTTQLHYAFLYPEYMPAYYPVPT